MWAFKLLRQEESKATDLREDSVMQQKKGRAHRRVGPVARFSGMCSLAKLSLGCPVNSF